MSAENSNPGVRAPIRQALHLDNVAGLNAQELAVRRKKRIEMVIGICWGIFVLKTFVVVWLVNHYNMPFSPMWIVAPTVSMAFIATAMYCWIRD